MLVRRCALELLNRLLTNQYLNSDLLLKWKDEGVWRRVVEECLDEHEWESRLIALNVVDVLMRLDATGKRKADFTGMSRFHHFQTWSYIKSL